MDKRSFSRVDREAKEGLESIKNDVPENRLQTTQQIADTDKALKVEPTESSFTAKKSKVKGATLKQQTIADVITGSGGSSGMGISAGGRSVSGTVGGVLGASNSTPVVEAKSRDKSRVGKKLDRTATKLNFTPSEQVFIAVDESKPLADAADADQGYNGTYRNENAKSQKIAGAVPGDLLFQRSVDLITKDKLYFVEGQQVFQVAGDKTNLNPTKSCFEEAVGSNGYKGNHDVTYHSGNFLHRAFHYGLTQDGKAHYFYADVDDLTPSGTVDAEIANVSSAHRLIKMNAAELDRQVIDAKAGDEKADLWSPLARAVAQPTQTSYFLSSVEADTGAYEYLAYSKAGTNMAYQLNRGPKDGLNSVIPGIEQLVGWRFTGDTNKSISESTMANCFNASHYQAGDPALMVGVYDSVAKYNNKADLLLQPRGYRMHLQTADNNMNPLKVPTEFANVFTSQETFSTIDHEYDPVLPICMTDRANLITVHNFNELAGFVDIPQIDIKYSSTNIESDYSYTAHTLLPKHILKALNRASIDVWVKKSAGDGLVYDDGVISFDPDSANLSNCVINIRLGTGAAPAGYNKLATYDDDDDFDLVLHLPKVQNVENKTVVTAMEMDLTFGATWYYDGAGIFSYQYSDLRNNYFVDVKHPLVEGIKQYIENECGAKVYKLLEPGKAIADFWIPLVFSTQYMTLAQLLICAATPWITKVRINSLRDIIYYEDNIGEYPFSKLDSIKNVPFHNYVNFTYSGYDEPLGVKVMNPSTAIQWVMPEFVWKVDTSTYVLPWYFNENELNNDVDSPVNLDGSAMSFPSIRSGVRLGALDNLYGMTEKDVRLSLDRLTKQLLQAKTISALKVYKYGRNTDGQPLVVLDNSGIYTAFDILACPRELGLCMDAPANIFTYTSKVPAALTGEANSSFAIKIWVNPKTNKTPSILNSTETSIDRAANFEQRWYILRADDSNSDTVLAGLVFGMNDEGAATFKPWANLNTGVQYTSGPEIVSLQRSLWTRIQMLPFVISPFDGHATSGSSVRDIYDIAYMFGLCGFRASDYRESVYNREKEVVNQGMLFVNDPWVIDSPIMKAGSTATGIQETRGYEIRKQ